MPTGIDLGTHSIKIVQVESKAKGFEVTHFQEMEIKSTEKEEISKILKHLIGTLPRKKGEIVVSVPSQKALLRELLVGFKEDDKIGMVIKSVAEPLLHNRDIEDVVLNYYKSREVGTQSKLLLTCLGKDHVRQHLALYQAAGIDPSLIDIDLSALFNFLTLAKVLKGDKTQIVIDIGKTSVKILLVEKGKLQLMRAMHFRNFPEWMDCGSKREPGEDGDDPNIQEDSYEAFKTYYSNRLKEKSPSSPSSSSVRSRGATPQKASVSTDMEATGMFEVFQEEDDEDLNDDDLSELGVSDSEDNLELSFSGEWDFVDLSSGDEIAAENGEDTSFLLLDSELLMDEEGDERVPIAVLSDEEFEALEIYEDFEEVSESELDRFYRRIFQEVERSVIYSGLHEGIDEIIITGGGSKIPEITTFFEAHFEVPTLIPRLPGAMVTCKNKNFPSLGLVAAGLALKGLDDPRYDTTGFDFRQEEFQYEKKYEKVKKGLALTFFLAFLTLFVWFQSLQKKLTYVEHMSGKAKKNQLKVYNTLFLTMYPKEKPLYPNNLFESINEKEKEIKREFGDSPEVPKLLSSLDILREIANISGNSGVQFKLVSASISQRGVQINVNVPNSQALSRLESVFQQRSKLLEVTGSQFNKPVSNIQFNLKK